MNYPFKNLEPISVWEHFYDITQVPRPSKKEEKIRQFLIDFAIKHHLEYKTDEVGNVLILKKASLGYENGPVVVLQSHMDMVCEKNQKTKFDFDQDAIQAWVDGEWVKAKGTTLGSDDGIGMAAAMAVLTASNLNHPRIEALFTMDEETGLTGAFGLKNDFLQGRILLNLDSEDEGEIFIGCAGGRDTIATLKIEKYAVNQNLIPIKLEVKGLLGGHSGDDINKGLANANKLLIRILFEAHQQFAVQLHSIDGGNLRNAIAREASAIIFIDPHQLENLKKLSSQYGITFKKEYHLTEPNIEVVLSETTALFEAIDEQQFIKSMQAIYACPHGVLAMSQDIAGFVETSTNLASIKIKGDSLVFTTSQRSSVASALDDACRMVNSTFSLIGAQVIHSDGYPGWTPNPKSKILKTSVESYEFLFKKTPKVLAIHAGLECGLIGEKYEGIDMISIGPTIKGAHSPDERLKIETVQMFWDHLVDILKRLK
jgi:dipeptidase D